MPELPVQIGPYTITREIGRGGMGVVYLARDTKLDRDVAIKALPEELAQDADRLARFEREAKTLAQLNHTNIAGIYGIEEQDGQKYLILEYVEGETLGDRLDRGALPVDEAIEIAVEIANGVEAAHEAGVIHRDLKPDNIKITPDGKVKVLDFGLARSEEGASSSSGEQHNSPTIPGPVRHSPTIPGAILGTAAYMSPEQARGRRIDKRTDIWSFGVILYELLTGIGPFHGETASDSIGAVLHKEIDLDRLPADAPLGLRRVLSRCLARDAAKRFRDIGDVRIDLNLAASGEVNIDAGGGKVGRSSIMVPALAGVLFGAIAIVAIAWSMWPSAAVQPVRRLDLGISQDMIEEPDMPMISPDGSKVVYRHRELLWVRELSHFEPRELLGTQGAVQPFWSPDGLWIGYAVGKQLMKTPVEGGRSERIASMPSAMTPSGGGAWLDDGTIIFCTGNEELFSVSSGGGRPEIWLSMEPNEEDFHNVAPLPGGRGVVFVTHTKTGPWKVSVADGSRRAHVADAITLRVHDPVYGEPGFILYQQRSPNAGLWAVPFDLNDFQATGKPFLIAGDATRPSISSDGTLVYLRNSAEENYQLAWIPFDGSPSEPIGEPTSLILAPVLNPEGSRIAYIGGDDGDELIIYEIAGGRRSVIAQGLDGAMEPMWSSDGDLIAITYETDGERQLSFFSADGTGKVGDDLAADWASFDSKWSNAAIERNGPEGNRSDIWYMPLDNPDDARPLIATAADEDWVRVSPNGEWLCYRSDVTGTGEFYLTRFPSGEGRWQVTNGGGSRLEWGPDGDRIYYDRPDDWALVEVPLNLDDGVVLGTPRRLWNRAETGVLFFQNFDVPPPGDRLLGVTYYGDQTHSPSIGIVQNWYEEYRQR